MHFASCILESVSLFHCFVQHTNSLHTSITNDSTGLVELSTNRKIATCVKANSKMLLVACAYRVLRFIYCAPSCAPIVAFSDTKRIWCKRLLRTAHISFNQPLIQRSQNLDIGEGAGFNKGGLIEEVFNKGV
jgi:hypothetical protein